MKQMDMLSAMGYALAPKSLVERKQKVRFMYRDTPDREEDSGWRFFTGDESDAYVNDPNNIGLYAISTIAEIDPDVIPLLNNPSGTAFEREDENKPFQFAPM